MQQRLIELALPDGQRVWALVDGPSGPRDTGLGEQVATRLEGLQESLHAAAANIRDAVAAARPDEVSAEFCLELAAGRGGVVAALTGVGGKATFKVALRWTGGAPDSAASPDDPANPSPDDGGSDGAAEGTATDPGAAA